MRRQNERRTVTWRRGYAQAVEAHICRTQHLTFEEWVRVLVRREVANAGLLIEEPRPGRKPAVDPAQPQLPAPVGNASYGAGLERALDVRITTEVLAASEGAEGPTFVEAQRTIEDVIAGANTDDPPLSEPPPPPGEESELDAHDREINEKLKELQGGNDEPF